MFIQETKIKCSYKKQSQILILEIDLHSRNKLNFHLRNTDKSLREEIQRFEHFSCNIPLQFIESCMVSS